MTFGAIAHHYQQLRNRLSVHLADGAPAEITVLPPAGVDDELSMLRLVTWAYVLLHETSRVHLKFLKEQPPLDMVGPLLPHVQSLRTWWNHQLVLHRDRDRALLANAQQWFRSACGVSVPKTSGHWGGCFAKLSEDLQAILSGAVEACERLDDPQDGPALVDELRSRVARNWDAYRFDELARDAMARLGYTGLDVVSLRQRKLDGWRQVLAVATDGAERAVLSRRMEADVLALMNDALPMAAATIVERLGDADPAVVAAALLLLRARWTRGRDAAALLALLDFEPAAAAQSR